LALGGYTVHHGEFRILKIDKETGTINIPVTANYLSKIALKHFSQTDIL